MIKKGFVPDVVFYSIIIDGFVKAWKLQQALKLYHNMKPYIFTYNSLVNGLCHGDRFPEPMKWLKIIFGEGLVHDMIVYTSVIASYCRH
jgi:pentatricopeptide repeat protein